VVRRGRRHVLGAAGRRGAIATVLLLVGVLLLLPVGRGVEVGELRVGADALPLHVYVPAGAVGSTGPGVVVVHGFAGSARLMHTWSLALAHAGFTVIAPDLPGHGRNATPLASGGDALDGAVDAAVAALAGLPSVDPDRIALLGHSMGSGAVLRHSIARPDVVRAVVAVSPTDAAVGATLPRDLLLLAGANEPAFVANAVALLERAGGEKGVPGDGEARSLVVVPRVEHVSILFSRAAHDASIGWLAAALAHEVTGRAPTGPLAGWSLVFVALLLLWQAAGSSAATPGDAPRRGVGAWFALPVGGVAATASLVIIVRSLDIPDLLGMLIAGELGLWFLMVGTVWLRFGVRPAPPDLRDIGWTVLASAVVVGLGASSSLAWASWWLPGVRIGPALVLIACLLPFSIAAATMLHGRRGRAAIGVWAFGAVSVVMTLGVAALVIPGLGFLVLILPLLPLVLAVTSAVALGLDRPWATGTAGAVFTGWLLAGILPLS